ncbi:MAG: RNA polymerase sigma factor [Planctomycetota bacterium]
MEVTETSRLLRGWHNGDVESLNQLVRQHLPWLRQYVRTNLGPALRTKAESGDLVQEALLEFLQCSPPFHLESAAHLRALLARIVRNKLCDQHDWFTAHRRNAALERPISSESVLELERGHPGQATPSGQAMKNEQEAWIRLALELMSPEDRDVIVLREFEELSFSEIAGRLSIGESAARKRYVRALPRLARLVEDLPQGNLAHIVAEELTLASAG